MDMLDRRGVTIQPGDVVRFNGFEGIAQRPLPDAWYEVAAGGVSVPVLPFELEVVARWYSSRVGPGFSTLRLRPGDRVHMQGDPRMFVVLDAGVERCHPSIPIGLADAGPMPPAMWKVGEKKLSLAEPYPVLEPCEDRQGNRLVAGDVVEVGVGMQVTRIAVAEISAANQACWAREALLVKLRKPEHLDLLDLYGRPLLLGDIVWRAGVQYRLGTVAHGDLRPADVFPVSHGDEGRHLPVVADRITTQRAMETWKAVAEHNQRTSALLFARESVLTKADAPPALTEGEAGALAALGKLGLAVEWGMFLGVLEHRWRRVHPRARLTWDVVGSPRGTFLDEPRGVLVTFGMEGLDPIQRFLPFDDVQSAKRKSAKKKSARKATSTAYVDTANGNDATGLMGDATVPFRTLKEARRCPNARAFVVDGVRVAPLALDDAPAPPPPETSAARADEAPFVEFETFAWDDELPPHLAASLISPWTSCCEEVRGFVLGEPSSSLRRVCAYQRASNVIRSVRREFQGDMARHYTPPKAETRPRSAIIDEFLGGIADASFRRVGPDEDDV